MAPLLTLGVGKAATAHVVRSAAAAYSERGFKYAIFFYYAGFWGWGWLIGGRFYYADERKADGEAAFRDIDGEAHGGFYVGLVEGKGTGAVAADFR